MVTGGKGSWYVCHTTVSPDTLYCSLREWEGLCTADKSDFQVNHMHGAGQKTLQC